MKMTRASSKLFFPGFSGNFQEIFLKYCFQRNFFSYGSDPTQAYQIDYYKGLGTSDAAEFKEYFVELSRHKIPFRYSGTECDDRIKLAFAKERVDDRKTWLTEYMLVSFKILKSLSVLLENLCTW